jgi:hypothetical protein
MLNNFYIFTKILIHEKNRREYQQIPSYEQGRE